MADILHLVSALISDTGDPHITYGSFLSETKKGKTYQLHEETAKVHQHFYYVDSKGEKGNSVNDVPANVKNTCTLSYSFIAEHYDDKKFHFEARITKSKLYKRTREKRYYYIYSKFA